MFFFVAVLPELLEEEQPKQSLLQVIFIIAGIVATAAVTLLIDWSTPVEAKQQKSHNTDRVGRKQKGGKLQRCQVIYSDDHLNNCNLIYVTTGIVLLWLFYRWMFRFSALLRVFKYKVKWSVYLVLFLLVFKSKKKLRGSIL